MTTLMLSQSLCNDLLGSEYMRGYVVCMFELAILS